MHVFHIEHSRHAININGRGMLGLPRLEGAVVVAIAATGGDISALQQASCIFCPGQNSAPPTAADFNQCSPFLKLQGRQCNHYLLPYILDSVLGVW